MKKMATLLVGMLFIGSDILPLFVFSRVKTLFTIISFSFIFDALLLQQ